MASLKASLLLAVALSSMLCWELGQGNAVRLQRAEEEYLENMFDGLNAKTDSTPVTETTTYSTAETTESTEIVTTQATTLTPASTTTTPETTSTTTKSTSTTTTTEPPTTTSGTEETTTSDTTITATDGSSTTTDETTTTDVTDEVTTATEPTEEPCDIGCIHGKCVDGACECWENFEGDLCQCLTEEALCEGQCTGTGQICQGACDTFACSCTNGTRPNPDNASACIDVDECQFAEQFEIDLCTSDNTKCVNADTVEAGWDGFGYTCECLDGFGPPSDETTTEPSTTMETTEPATETTTDEPATTEPTTTETAPGLRSMFDFLILSIRDPNSIVCEVLDGECNAPGVCDNVGEVPGTCNENGDFLYKCGCEEIGFVQNEQPAKDEPKCFAMERCFEVSSEITNCTYSNWYSETCSLDTGKITCKCPTGTIPVPGTDAPVDGVLCRSPSFDPARNCNSTETEACNGHLPCIKYLGTATAVCSCQNNTVLNDDGTCQEKTDLASCSPDDIAYCWEAKAHCDFNPLTGVKQCTCTNGFKKNPKASPPFASCLPDEEQCKNFNCSADSTCFVRPSNGVPGCKCNNEYLTFDENSRECKLSDACEAEGYDVCAKKSQKCRTTSAEDSDGQLVFKYECFCPPPFEEVVSTGGCKFSTTHDVSRVMGLNMTLKISNDEAVILMNDAMMNTAVFVKYERLLAQVISSAAEGALANINSFYPVSAPAGKVPETEVKIGLTVVPTKGSALTDNQLATNVQAAALTGLDGSTYFQVGSEFIMVDPASIESFVAPDENKACTMFNPTCPAGSTCKDGSDYVANSPYTCACGTGYEGIGLSMDMFTEVCQDIDECAAGASACADGTAYVCINTPGSFECPCNYEEGYTVDPESSGNSTCVPPCYATLSFTHECENDNRGTCEFDPTIKEPVCKCKKDYKGEFCRSKISNTNNAGVVGGVLGGILAVVVIAAGIVIYRLKKKSKRQSV